MKSTQPDWPQQSFFYHLYPLGACGCLKNAETQPTKPISYLSRYIPQWKNTGANAIYLGPVFLSETHGYDTIDYETVDPRLGTLDDMKLFVQELKAHGFRIVFDAVFNHVGREFPFFKDVLEKKQSSPYTHWFSGLDFSTDNPFQDGFSYDCWDGHFNLVKLNVDHPEVAAHLFDAVQWWVDTFGIDGLRLDAADQLSPHFLRQLRQFTNNLPQPIWLMGELLHGDYNQWVNGQMLHSCTNYELYKGLFSSHNDKNLYELAHSLNRQFERGGLYAGKTLYNFPDNHDVERIASILNDERNLYPLHILLMTVPGIPSIYYESEYGVYGQKGGDHDNDLRPAIGDKEKNHPDLRTTIRHLAKIRQLYPVLQTGSYQQCYLGHEQFGFYRKQQNNEALVVINLSDSEKTIDIMAGSPYNERNGEMPEYLSGTWKDILNDGETLHFSKGSSWVHLYPGWGRIFVR